MPYAVLEKQFDLLTADRQKSVYSFIGYLLTEQQNETKSLSSSIEEKLSFLESISGIVPSNVDLDAERTKRILHK